MALEHNHLIHVNPSADHNHVVDDVTQVLSNEQDL